MVTSRGRKTLFRGDDLPARIRIKHGGSETKSKLITSLEVLDTNVLQHNSGSLSHR